MKNVRPKKFLGQHFLADEQIAKQIVQAVTVHRDYKYMLEIGPGMGVLTKYLLKDNRFQTHVVELDRDSVAYLKINYPELADRIIEKDFLKMDINTAFENPLGIIGNFPYNISSQIFFNLLETGDQVNEVVCMIQKEVAERIVSPPGNRVYGILSVLLQAYYDIEYLFTVEPAVFRPPPKVRSAVIRLKRNERDKLGCDPKLFKIVVKEGFQNRRKTLRNALKRINLPEEIRALPLLDKRAEQLSVEDYISLTKKIAQI